MLSAIVLVLLCAVAVVLLECSQKHRRPPLPPGPPAEPLIGHLRVFPAQHQAETFRKWASTYGNVLYFNVAGQSIVVLNSYKDAINLLEKRSSLYSDRPKNITTLKLMGFEGLTGVQPYGQRWRLHRRLLQESLLAKSCTAYEEAEVREARNLLKNLLLCNGDCTGAVERYAAVVPLEVAYGHQISADDGFLELAKKATHAAEIALRPAVLLDYFPFLQHLPRWLPGCSSIAAMVHEWRPVARRMYDGTFDTVREQMTKGNARPSFVSTYVERFESRGGLTKELSAAIRDCAAVFVMAGYDTTLATLMTFIRVMLLFPDVQRKAQAEIDRMIGTRRLPTFGDRAALPYLACVQKEITRWHPVVPTGLAHCSVADDVYDGMFIPKGSIIIANAFGMTRDPSAYRDPERFYPERFLPEPLGYGETHLSVEFGFGRRICPGRHLAEAATWIAMASIISTLDITPAVGEDNQPIVHDLAFTDSIVSRPVPFKCTIVPRSEEMRSLIAASA